MKLLDKYILKTFLVTFFFVVVILLSVITVIDLTDKMDKFSAANLHAKDIAYFYLVYIPGIGSLLTPITIFIAAVYVCSRMAGHTEIIAMLSAGISFRRMLAPYLVGAAFVGAINFTLTGWIIPNATKQRVAFELQYLKNKYYFDKRNIHIQVAPDVYMYMQSYNNSNQTGYHFTLEKFQHNRLVEKLTADRIEWDTTKHKWVMRDWMIRRVDSLFHIPTALEVKQGYQPHSALPDSAKVFSGSSRDTALVIQPKEFESDYLRSEGLTITELNEYIDMLSKRGSTGVELYQVEKYTRFTSPFTILILVFMGVIVSSRKSRGGTGLQIALGFVLSFLFILFFTLFRTFAEAGSLPPQISVWIPNITFFIITLIMYKYVPR